MQGPHLHGRDRLMSKGYGKSERINASYSAVPATECIGAGRIEGWFNTETFMADKRGWGHVQSNFYEGDLFFHLQRSPLLRGVNFRKKDPVTFEVVEINGRCEAVKLMTTKVQEEEELRKQGILVDDKDAGKPDPKELVGTRVAGAVQSQYQLMLKQKWGFATSDDFAGKVFWHITENPDMQEVEFEREDLVEYDLVIDDARGAQVRARNMKWLRGKEQPIMRQKAVSDKKQRKREELMKNWRKGPPPDWDCKGCNFHNFGRNKTCKNCQTGTRPPREEWAPEEDEVKEPEHQPLVIPPPVMGGPLGDDPITQPGWLPETWNDAKPPDEKAENSWDSPGSGPHHQSQGGGGVPFSQIDNDGSLQGKMDLLMSTFNDVIETHDPQRTGESYVFRLRALLQEVNEVLGADRSSKHSFAMELAQHPWFAANRFEVRYQPSKNRIGISATEEKEAVEDDDWGPQKRKVEDDWGW